MAYKHLKLERKGAVSILTLASGKLNAISSEVIAEVGTALDHVDQDAESNALILTGGESRFFSYGLDVAYLLTLDYDGMAAFLHDLNAMLRRFYMFPQPVVAALNGHTMAGGLLLAMTADLRLAARGEFSYGLSEIKLGLAAPAASVRILAQRIGHARAHALCLSGAIYDPDEAKALDLVDEVVPPKQLMDRAMEHASIMATLPTAAFALYEQYLNTGIYDVDSAREREEDRQWLELWFQPETQARLKKLVERA